MGAKPPAPARSEMERWFPHRRGTPEARLRLVCFPFAGGGASSYRAWPAELPRSVELWAAELPGRETRFGEPLAPDLSSIVSAVSEPVLADARPVALFGHSLGAIIAFELAHVLTERGRAPIQLFVSGARGPDVPRRNEIVHTLPDAELLQKIAAYQGTPREVLADRELMELLLPVLRGDFRLAERYVHVRRAPLPCPISAFGGTEDADVSDADLAAWQKHTQARFNLELFAGNHFFVTSARREVLRAVISLLDAR